MDKIVIIGWGHIAESLSEFPGVIGYAKEPNLNEIYDCSTHEYIGEVNPKIHKGVIGIGKAEYKEESAANWFEKGYSFGRLIHPSAYVSQRAKIGEGSVVMQLAFIDERSQIGKCCIISPQASLRWATIGDYCHISLQAMIMPCSCVKHHTMIGAGVAVLEDKTVGARSAVGANSVVVDDIPDKTLFYNKVANPVFKQLTTTYPLTSKEKGLDCRWRNLK